MPGTVTGKHTLWDVSLTVNGVTLSDHVDSVDLQVGQDSIDITPLPSSGVVQAYELPTMLTVKDVTITFYQDFDVAKVYATFLGLWQNQTVFNIVGKASSGATTATNPAFTIPVFVRQLPFLAGKRGAPHMAPVVCGVGGALTIATS